MKYGQVISGKFISRPNRFIAYVDINGEIELVHVKNTGRCRELLTENALVYLSVSDNPTRKTKYDIIAVEKITAEGVRLINMDSQVVNAAAEEWLKKGELFSHSAIIRREVTYKNSRFDFYIEDGDEKAFLEVKGVTLERGGEVLFPDAPTERGVRHVRELTGLARRGERTAILFVIQMSGIRTFMPNDSTHAAFGDALREAASAGVQIIARECFVDASSISITNPVPVCL